ncbi:hypothetical protein VOLCADRAFT_92769 [Volvox carteri f. nagariensis]|uniref:Uncharacterized protein n=1 Tax=Volvox carteri f. nagariensis TaxID=3068 RepID=D8U0X2_VOLCA|nr:uncharacterized protein VOLCADRAFT_92769 [Volvox carteri f. nagariensis]EFJ46624.1 hypothetical protein VOLCADRAFT_92769 [Volvox carteri f. nagariensis]|eukprot:XP_002952153.1 hypothetical protein VOLCADRAFT_92769 [Volvox carteri f. nagariensis]
MAEAARGGRGAFASCRALRDAFHSVVRFPNMFSRYCLSAWGPHDAIWKALGIAPHILGAVTNKEREQKLRALLRALVEGGADVTVAVTKLIMRVISIGSVNLLSDLLQLLDSEPGKDEKTRGQQRGLMVNHVASCCTALTCGSCMPQFNQEVVRLLVRAITVTAGVPIHMNTLTKALSNAACRGRASAVEGLLEACPSPECIDAALYFTSKTRHGGVMGQLINAGGKVTKHEMHNALYGAYPEMVWHMIHALRRDGVWNRDLASEVLSEACTSSSSLYEAPDAQLVRRAATLRMLVSEFDADPSARGSGCLAVASAQTAPFDRLAELMMLMGADIDAALLTLCSSAPEDGPLARWQKDRHSHGVRGLLALGAETPAGASQAACAALERNLQEPMQLLVGSGAVPAVDCEALLSWALGTPSAAAAPHGAAAHVGPADGAAMAGQRRWDCVQMLVQSGAVSHGAVQRALQEACRRGDVEAVGELASLGVGGPESCNAAFWLAFEGRHYGCMQRLQALGAVTAEVWDEAARVEAARKKLRHV